MLSEKQSDLSQEQRLTLQDTYTFVKNSTYYLRSVLPLIPDEGPDARLLKVLVDLGYRLLSQLPERFPELQEFISKVEGEA